MTEIKIGDTVYIPTSLHLGRGRDDVVGGLATVTKIEDSKSAGKMVLFITVSENPTVRYNWRILSERQEELKERFGIRRAYLDPDNREEFNDV